VNRERAGLESASQGRSLYHAEYHEESLNCRDWSSIARSGGGTQSAEMTVVFLKAGVIACKQHLIFRWLTKMSRLVLTETDWVGRLGDHLSEADLCRPRARY
jgi:hypothetical protein